MDGIDDDILNYPGDDIVGGNVVAPLPAFAEGGNIVAPPPAAFAEGDNIVAPPPAFGEVNPRLGLTRSQITNRNSRCVLKRAKVLLFKAELEKAEDEARAAEMGAAPQPTPAPQPVPAARIRCPPIPANVATKLRKINNRITKLCRTVNNRRCF